MRCSVLSLVALIAATSAGYAQNQKSSSGGLQGAFGARESATGGLRGVYAPPDSGVGHLRGVYNPPQPMAPTALPSTLTGPSSTTSDSVPNITVSGKAEVGQLLPQGVTPSPMSDRAGYGRAIVNGHNAIIDTNDNRIIQFSD